ncbi:BA75_02161T0 [Komagataella pastoris]|uniref:BA75_02161T0 n=1 Tax=Komagataella pastoris TaxID=4922 RepID=A0A1B2JAV7_PICPA|nr:BA75_02161T0 [Komagataella pastoris]
MYLSVRQFSSQKSCRQLSQELLNKFEEYIVYQKTPKKLKTMIYRPTNSQQLIAADLIDSTGKPLAPQTYKGPPRQNDLVKLINQCESYDEFLKVRQLIFDVTKNSKKKPSILTSKPLTPFLIKAAQLNRLPHSLTTLWTLPTEWYSQFDPSIASTVVMLEYLKIAERGTTDQHLDHASLDKRLQKSEKILRDKFQDAIAEQVHQDPLTNLLKLSCHIKAEEINNFNSVVQLEPYLELHLAKGASIKLPDVSRFALKSVAQGSKFKIYSQYKYDYCKIQIVSAALNNLQAHISNPAIAEIIHKLTPFLDTMETIGESIGYSNLLVEFENTMQFPKHIPPPSSE